MTRSCFKGDGLLSPKSQNDNQPNQTSAVGQQLQREYRASRVSLGSPYSATIDVCHVRRYVSRAEQAEKHPHTTTGLCLVFALESLKCLDRLFDKTRDFSSQRRGQTSCHSVRACDTYNPQLIQYSPQCGCSK